MFVEDKACEVDKASDDGDELMARHVGGATPACAAAPLGVGGFHAAVYSYDMADGGLIDGSSLSAPEILTKDDGTPLVGTLPEIIIFLNSKESYLLDKGFSPHLLYAADDSGKLEQIQLAGTGTMGERIGMHEPSSVSDVRASAPGSAVSAPCGDFDARARPSSTAAGDAPRGSASVVARSFLANTNSKFLRLKVDEFVAETSLSGPGGPRHDDARISPGAQPPYNRVAPRQSSFNMTKRGDDGPDRQDSPAGAPAGGPNYPEPAAPALSAGSAPPVKRVPGAPASAETACVVTTIGDSAQQQSRREADKAGDRQLGANLGGIDGVRSAMLSQPQIRMQALLLAHTATLHGDRPRSDAATNDDDGDGDDRTLIRKAAHAPAVATSGGGGCNVMSSPTFDDDNLNLVFGLGSDVFEALNIGFEDEDLLSGLVDTASALPDQPQSISTGVGQRTVSEELYVATHVHTGALSGNSDRGAHSALAMAEAAAIMTSNHDDAFHALACDGDPLIPSAAAAASRRRSGSKRIRNRRGSYEPLVRDRAAQDASTRGNEYSTRCSDHAVHIPTPPSIYNGANGCEPDSIRSDEDSEHRPSVAHRLPTPRSSPIGRALAPTRRPRSAGQTRPPSGNKTKATSGGARASVRGTGDTRKPGQLAQDLATERKNRITLADLCARFDMPLAEAAADLGICATILKKVCRKFGVQRWPHRGLKRLNTTLAMMEEQLFGEGEGDQTAKVRSLSHEGVCGALRMLHAQSCFARLNLTSVSSTQPYTVFRPAYSHPGNTPDGIRAPQEGEGRHHERQRHLHAHVAAIG